MAYPTVDYNFIDNYTTRIAIFEERLTNKQLQYLYQYYAMNKYAGRKQIREIAKLWNIYDFGFFMDLVDWFFNRNIVEGDRIYRRYQLRTIGA